jgi:hypothetical protein
VVEATLLDSRLTVNPYCESQHLIILSTSYGTIEHELISQCLSLITIKLKIAISPFYIGRLMLFFLGSIDILYRIIPFCGFASCDV